MDQALENAIRFISNTLLENPAIDRLSLVETAGKKFDLTPLQTESLLMKYVLNETKKKPQ